MCFHHLSFYTLTFNHSLPTVLDCPHHNSLSIRISKVRQITSVTLKTTSFFLTRSRMQIIRISLQNNSRIPSKTVIDERYLSRSPPHILDLKEARAGYNAERNLTYLKSVLFVCLFDFFFWSQITFRPPRPPPPKKSPGLAGQGDRRKKQRGNRGV